MPELGRVTIAGLQALYLDRMGVNPLGYRVILDALSSGELPGRKLPGGWVIQKQDAPDWFERRWPSNGQDSASLQATA